MFNEKVTSGTSSVFKTRSQVLVLLMTTGLLLLRSAGPRFLYFFSFFVVVFKRIVVFLVL